jgi:hypothetical protein
MTIKEFKEYINIIFNETKEILDYIISKRTLNDTHKILIDKIKSVE